MAIDINDVRRSGNLLSGAFVSGTIPDQETQTKAQIRALIASGELTVFRKGSSVDNALLTKDEILSLVGEERNSMVWRGNWSSTGHHKNDVVRDGHWLMIANTNTSQRAAPQPDGNSVLDPGVAPTFTDATYTGVVRSGVLYTFSKTGWIESLEIYVPEVSATIKHRVFMIDVTNPESKYVYMISLPVLTSDGWLVVAAGRLMVAAGQKIMFIIDTQNESADTTFTGQWTYEGTSAIQDVASKSWNTDSGETILRISNLDDSSVNRQAELATLKTGDTVRMSFDANNYREYRLTAPGVAASSYYRFEVEINAAGGGIPKNTLTTLLGTVFTNGVATYSEEIGYRVTNGQPSFGSAEGVLMKDGSSFSVPNNAYGVRVTFQAASVATDWDMLSFNGSSDNTPLEGGSTENYFIYKKTTNFVVPGTTYTQVDWLTTASWPSGTYMFLLTFTTTSDSITESQYIRYSLDGGVSWNEYAIEAKDATDTYPFAYSFPFEHSGGPLDCIVEARKETGTFNMTISYLDIVFERKA